MKKLLICIVVIIVVALFWFNKHLSDEMYNECMESKKVSQEQCEYVAYYK